MEEVLKLTTEVSSLKERGYTFQKLYAANYKSYRKKINEYTIWVWVKNSSVEIEDWFENTSKIVQFYKNNYDRVVEENQKLPRPIKYMILQLNSETGEVREKDRKHYLEQLISGKWDEDYEDWREIVLTFGLFDEVIKEYDFLTKQI